MGNEYCPNCGSALPYNWVRDGRGGFCPRCRRMVEGAIEAAMTHDDPIVVNDGDCEVVANLVQSAIENLEKMDTADLIRTSDGIRDDEELPDEPVPYHVWLTDGDLHYDAENPHGVRSPFELTYFSERWREDLAYWFGDEYPEQE